MQVSLNLYREKEAVAAEVKTSVAPPPIIRTATLTTRQQELMLALVQSMTLRVLEVVEGKVTPKPTTPMPAGAN